MSRGRNSRYSDALAAGRSGVRASAGIKDFLFLKNFREALGLTQPPIPLSFTDVKRPGCTFDHSPPPITEVMNKWSCTSTPLISFYGMDEAFFTLTFFSFFFYLFYQLREVFCRFVSGIEYLVHIFLWWQ